MANGGIIGPVNYQSYGKCTVTNKTSSGTVTTQPGTRVVQALIIAGGGAGGSASGSSNQGGGGGGAGGYLCTEVNVNGNSPYTATVGAGAAATPSGPNNAASGTHLHLVLLVHQFQQQQLVVEQEKVEHHPSHVEFQVDQVVVDKIMKVE